MAFIGRRKFITLLGGAAAAWPIGLAAQQSDRMRKVGVLMGAVANSPHGQARIAAFQQGLQQLGWTEASGCCRTSRRSATLSQASR